MAASEKAVPNEGHLLGKTHRPLRHPARTTFGEEHGLRVVNPGREQAPNIQYFLGPDLQQRGGLPDPGQEGRGDQVLPGRRLHPLLPQGQGREGPSDDHGVLRRRGGGALACPAREDCGQGPGQFLAGQQGQLQPARRHLRPQLGLPHHLPAGPPARTLRRQPRLPLATKIKLQGPAKGVLLLHHGLPEAVRDGPGPGLAHQSARRHRAALQ